jgi:hypothetical protein
VRVLYSRGSQLSTRMGLMRARQTCAAAQMARAQAYGCRAEPRDGGWARSSPTGVGERSFVGLAQLTWPVIRTALPQSNEDERLGDSRGQGVLVGKWGTGGSDFSVASPSRICHLTVSERSLPKGHISTDNLPKFGPGVYSFYRTLNPLILDSTSETCER